MIKYIEKYHQRFGYYPKDFFCSQNILHISEPGSPKREKHHASGKTTWKAIGNAKSSKSEPAQSIDGKFGQAKSGYGLNRIKARLRERSETWIARYHSGA